MSGQSDMELMQLSKINVDRHEIGIDMVVLCYTMTNVFLPH